MATFCPVCDRKVCGHRDPNTTLRLLCESAATPLDQGVARFTAEVVRLSGAAIVLVTLALGIGRADATPSQCAKLPEATCTTTTGCTWKALKKDGTAMKVAPHCRLAPGAKNDNAPTK